MAFLNQCSCLITDSHGNIYNFLWNGEDIEYIYFDKSLGKAEKKEAVKNVLSEFDAVIDRNDTIYILCQKKDGKVVLVTCNNNIWSENILRNDVDKKVFNFNITINNYINIFYNLPIDNKGKNFALYHHYNKNGHWRTYELDRMKVKNLLNSIGVISGNGKLTVGYYNLEEQYEQIFIKNFDEVKQQWGKSIKLTNSNVDKMYLDIIDTGRDDLNISYSEHMDGNLVIKVEKYKLNKNNPKKSNEKILSNLANCTYSTFVKYQNKLWNVWTEYEYVISSYSEDNGDTWSEPYVWNKSKEVDFLRYRFSTNERNINNKFKLNYSFGEKAPNIELIGFGPLKDTTEVKIKRPKGNIEESKERINKHEKKHKYKWENNIHDSLENNKYDFSEDEISLDQNNNGGYNKGTIRRVQSTKKSEVNENIKDDIKNLEEKINSLYKRIESIEENFRKLKKEKEDYKKHNKKERKVEENTSKKDDKNISDLQDRIEKIESYFNRRRGPIFPRRF